MRTAFPIIGIAPGEVRDAFVSRLAGGPVAMLPKHPRPAPTGRTMAASPARSAPAKADTFAAVLEQRQKDEAALAEAIRPLTAALDGKKAGEQYHGDPWFAARQLNIPVVLKDLNQANAIGRFCWLNADPSSPWIEVHEGLPAYKRDQTVAFELARFYGYRDDPLPLEDPCSLAFAKAFLDERPELVRQRAAAKFQRDVHDRAVREAKLRAAMR